MDLTPEPSEDQERSEKQRLGCPECAPGAANPHDEPDLPHIHLTAYGYLIYGPSHEHCDFIEEMRAAAYRAGREDAAKAIEQDPNSRDCFWDTADSWWNGYDAAKERAAALARGQHTQDGDER